MEKILKDEEATFLTSAHVPTLATRGVIWTLLRYVPLRGLNRQAALDDIMTYLLEQNHLVHELTTLTSMVPEGKEVPAKLREEASGWLENILKNSAPRVVHQTLEIRCQHARDRMRKESDEVLELLQLLPFHASRSQRVRWIDGCLPTILSWLKDNQKCFVGCPARTAWTPGRSAKIAMIDVPPAIENRVAMKNAILAYFHGLQPHTIRHYLDGRPLKSGSRSRQPGS
ncbi:MAG: hypothetical protein OJF50_001591 [Nitrospira sp.]|jgi:hypothetical protein|nr:hypothetical protein [Nitrospira sp.]